MLVLIDGLGHLLRVAAKEGSWTGRSRRKRIARGSGTTVEEVNALLKAASETAPLRGILGYETRPLVSIDFKGNPASATSAFEDEEILETYPFAPVILESLELAAPRPQTPYYNEVSAGLQETWHPPSGEKLYTLGATFAEYADVAYELARGNGATALVFNMHASVTGALATTHPGAIDGLPTRDEIEAFLHHHA